MPRGGVGQPAPFPDRGRGARGVPRDEDAGPERDDSIQPTPTPARPSSSSPRPRTTTEDELLQHVERRVGDRGRLRARPHRPPSWSSRPSRSASPRACGTVSPTPGSSSRRSSSARAGRSRTTSTRRRIIVGDTSAGPSSSPTCSSRAPTRHDVPVLLTNPTEAEAIKLFANTYLAMRVAYFNELDTYAATHGLDTTSDHRGRRPRPAHRRPLQQPVVRLRRLLPAQGHQAAARQLRRGPADLIQRDRRLEHDAQGLHRHRRPPARSAGRRDVPAR